MNQPQRRPKQQPRARRTPPPSAEDLEWWVCLLLGSAAVLLVLNFGWTFVSPGQEFSVASALVWAGLSLMLLALF